MDKHRVERDCGGKEAYGGVYDGIGGSCCRLKACAEIAGGKSASGGRRHRIAPTPRRSTLKGSSILSGVCDVAFLRPLQGRMVRVVALPWAASACGGLAHGYYRSAFRAVFRYDAEVAESVTDPAWRDACPCFSSVTSARANAASSIHWTFDSPIQRRLSMPPTHQFFLHPKSMVRFEGCQVRLPYEKRRSHDK